MNPTLFFKNFELLADAPNGVQKLRELILQLAVMGKLVPQDPNDEPAAVLLEKIKAEKNKLVKGNNGRNQKTEAINNEIFDIPSNWIWTKLGNLGITQTGTTPSKSEPKFFGNYIPFIKPADLSESGVRYDNEMLSELGLNSGRLIPKSSVLMVCIGGSIGKTGLVDRDVSCNQQINAISPFSSVDYKFTTFVLKSRYFQDKVMEKASIGTLPIINKSKWEQIFVPLPPLAEQKRIVSKVEELMTLCDKLEARRQKKQEIQSKLNNAALEKMLSTENQEEFEQNWQRICENFDLLYDNPENVEKLKQAILQLAVQGKLVPQTPGDEPASVLIEKISNEKRNLSKVGKIKGTKSVSLETTDNIPILPEKWELVNLDSIILFMDAGWSPACKNHPTEDELTWGVLKTTSVQPLMFLWTEHKELPESLTPRPEYEVRTGDILITRAGPKNRVGICCLVKDTRSRLMISDKIIRFHLLDEFVFPEFVALCLNTGFSQSYVESQKSGMAESQMNISQNKLRMTPIPIPPLEEQKRIVEKVGQLMGLCDELESKLRREREDSGKLMETVVKGLLEGAAAQK